MNYQEYAKSKGIFDTVIHTRINRSLKITSIYRKFANSNFESWGWETLLWKNDTLTVQYGILYTPEQVVNLHTLIIEYFKATGEVYVEE